MEQSQVELFCLKIDQLKEQGLKDIKFYPGMVSEAVPEEFAAEANNLVDVIMAGNGKKLRFNDSRRK